MLRSRVSSKLDVGRMAQAVSRPGIDPRTWVSLAVALDDSHVDPLHGVFVDVQLMPTGEEYTAAVAPDYGGNGFGFYASEIKKDDDLVVVIPGGDPRLGLFVVKRLWNASAPPPAEAVSAPTEVALVLEKDKTLRLKVSGTGTIHIETGGGNVVVNPGSGKVFLGADSLVTPNDGVVHGSGIDSFTGAPYYALQNVSQVVHAKKGP